MKAEGGYEENGRNHGKTETRKYGSPLGRNNGLTELRKQASLELRIQESTEKPEGRKFIASQWTYGRTGSSCRAAELRKYRITNLRNYEFTNNGGE